MTTNLIELHSRAVNQIDNEFSNLKHFLKDAAKSEEIHIINTVG